MNRKLIAILVSLLTAGATAPVFAAGACCATGPDAGARSAQAASPTRMMLTSYEKISNALAADNLADAQAAARTFAAVADITGTDLGCPVPAKKDCADKTDCADKKEACEVAKKDCGDSGKGCTKGLQAFIQAENIKEAREQFKLVSAQAIRLAASEEGYFVMTCPMAGEGGDWLQSDREVRNPYHGSSMLRCGSVKPLETAGTGAE